MALKKGVDVKPAKGKLGILLPGMGAVATTFIAGVQAIRRGIGKPIGSLTQLGHIRLGKRTDDNSPAIKDYVSLAEARRHRVRRLGHLPGQRLPGRGPRRRARRQAPRSAQGRARGDQADAGGVRAGVRQEAHRAQRQEGHVEDAPRRAGDGRHQARSRRPTAAIAWSRCGAARPRSIASRPRSTARSTSSRPACARRTTTSRRRRSTRTRASRWACRTPTARRTCRSTRPRCSSSRASRACRSPARTSRPARR